MRRQIIGALVASTLLTGCARDVRPPADPVMVSLATTAHRIRRELSLLRRVQQATLPKAPVYALPHGVLAQPVQLTWSGRLSPAVRALAALLGKPWTVQVTGLPPTTPVIVAIRSRKTPAFRILESLGWQAGRRAGIVIHQQTHVIQVVYVGR